MGEKRVCDGCGKDYWWPSARWQHDRCVQDSRPSEGVGVDGIGQEVTDIDTGQVGDGGIKRRSGKTGKFDKVAYQREYMRKRRAK